MTTIEIIKINDTLVEARSIHKINKLLSISNENIIYKVNNGAATYKGKSEVSKYFSDWIRAKLKKLNILLTFLLRITQPFNISKHLHENRQMPANGVGLIYYKVGRLAAPENPVDYCPPLIFVIKVLGLTKKIISPMKRSFCIFLITTAFFSVSMNAIAQQVDPATKSISNWYPIDTLPAPTRTDAMFCQSANYGFILGGTNWVRGTFTTALKDFWKFDATTNRWTSLPSFAGGKRGGGVMACNGESTIYAGLGCDGHPGTCYNDWWKFDLKTLTWSSVTSLPSKGRFTSGLFILNGKFYVVGGKTCDGKTLNETWQYDPSTDKWTAKANYPDTIRQSCAFTLNNGVKDYGYVADGYSQSFYKYDDATNSWSPAGKTGIAALPIEGKATTVFNVAYLIGGDISAASPHVRSYDPVADSWTRHADYGYTPARESQIVWYFNKFIIYTGMGANFYPINTYNDMYCFKINDLDKLYYNNENLIKISNAGLLQDVIGHTIQNGTELTLQNISGGTITMVNTGNIEGTVGIFDRMAKLFWNAKTNKWHCYVLF